ncbi:MAG: chemotaxis protein CheX [Bdellovibrionaceae bacterium]|nr:chemotaxis protein CheX [Pseudobdellovibrionaceae bacterium]
MKAYLINPASIHILDFHGVDQLGEDYKLQLLAYAQIVKGGGKFLYSIGMSEDLKNNIKRRETLDFIGIKNTISDVPGVMPRKEAPKTDEGKTNTKFVLTANYLQLFMARAKYVLESEMHVPVQGLKPYIKGMRYDRFNVEVTSILEIKSNYLKGWFAYTFDTSTFKKVHRKITGEILDNVTVESLDTISELLNITYGCIKQDLNKGQTFIEMSLPVKVLPENMDLYHKHLESSVIIPFQTKFGFIGFEISMDRNG